MISLTSIIKQNKDVLNTAALITTPYLKIMIVIIINVSVYHTSE